MECASCVINQLIYQVHFKGEKNEQVLPKLIDHTKRIEAIVKVQENILHIKESFIQDIIDFCTDYMDVEEMEFRVSGTEQWEPFEKIELTKSREWIDELILSGSITPFFQPIVNGKKEIFAYEVLARFIDGDNKVIPAGEIFTAARKRNRLFALDKLCRITAIRQANKTDKKLFVNFIPTSIYSPEHCLQSTMAAIQEIGVDPSRIVFEVVETEKVDDTNHLKRILMYYKERGFHYALDDVGQGYSTTELLKELAPNYMKLDMEYVQGVSVDQEKQKMAQLMLTAAKEVGAIPLAEGIENEADFEWLKTNGYELFQGYYFGKPSPKFLEKEFVEKI